MAGNGSELLSEQHIHRFGCLSVQGGLLKIGIRMFPLLEQRMPDFLQHLLLRRRGFYIPLQDNPPLLACVVHVEVVPLASPLAGLFSNTPELSPTPSCINPSAALLWSPSPDSPFTNSS